MKKPGLRIRKNMLIAGIVFVVFAITFVAIFIYSINYQNPLHKTLRAAGILEKTFQVGDINFNYAEGPDNGPALLLLHAQTLDWFTYSRVLQELSRDFHVYAVDYPGHGKTTFPEGYDMKADQIGSDLARFIENAIGEPVFISGNSSGGLLTVWLAANRPDLVKAIVLEDPPLFSSEADIIHTTIADKLFTASYKAVNDPAYAGNFLDYWIENGKDFFRTYTGPFSQQIIRYVVRNYKKANPGKAVEIAFLPVTVQEMLRGLNYYDPQFGAAFHTGTWNAGFDHAAALQKIQCHTLIIQANFEIMPDGTLNGAMTKDQAERAVSLVSESRYIKVDAGHVTNLEAPDQFIQILKDFFLGE